MSFWNIDKESFVFTGDFFCCVNFPHCVENPKLLTKKKKKRKKKIKKKQKKKELQEKQKKKEKDWNLPVKMI